MLTRIQQAAHAVAAAGGGTLDLLLPDACQGCEEWIVSERGGLCEACRGELERMAHVPTCPRCARSMQPLSIRPDDCAGCRTERFWNVAEVIRVGEYTGPLRAMIVRLKYRGQRRDADYLGRLLAERIAAADWFPALDAIVPVPMHRLRRLQRPCNHAYALAEACLRHLRRQARAGPPSIQTAVVWRSRYSPSQTRQSSREARFENVRDCFKPRPWWHWPPWRPRLDGLTVCVVDNLVVSGATITEMSKVLRRLGAKRIYAAILARTPPPGETPRRVPAAASP